MRPCAANNTLRRHLEFLSGNYPVVVIDNEAGMEHLSRRTTAKIDLLLLVSEPSPVGIMTAARIRDLARELEVTVARTGLVDQSCASGPAIAARLVEEARGHGLEVLGTVPMDDAVVEQAMAHLPAFRLPDDAPAVKAIESILANRQRVLKENEHGNSRPIKRARAARRATSGCRDVRVVRRRQTRGAERSRWAVFSGRRTEEGEDGGKDH